MPARHNRGEAPRFLPVSVPANQLHQFALIGASIELERIEAERDRILESFPELRQATVPLELVPEPAQVEEPQPAARPKAKRTITPAQRHVISRRMRAYWARRRKEREAEQKK